MADEPHIALLRGINVGGRNKVPMAELRDLLTRRGFMDVRTYIQSGNVILRSDGREDEIVERVHTAILERFDLEVPVIVRTTRDFETVAASHPLSAVVDDPRFLMVAFLDREPGEPVQSRLDASEFAPDRFEGTGREIYLAYPNGSGRSKLSHTLLERRLGVTVTARNWKTVRALADMLGG